MFYAILKHLAEMPSLANPLNANLSNHLQKISELANLINADLSRGFTVAQVAEKHKWTEPMAWSVALEGKSDLDRFKALGWGLKTWNQWEWNRFIC